MCCKFALHSICIAHVTIGKCYFDATRRSDDQHGGKENTSVPKVPEAFLVGTHDPETIAKT